MKNCLKIAGLGMLTVFLAACNTVEGVGKDVEAGGEVIQDTSDSVKEEVVD